MQNAGMLADQCGSDANWRARSMAKRANVPPVRIVVNLTVLLGSSRFAGESRDEDCARTRVNVAAFGDLLTPSEDAIHQHMGQGLGRMTADERAPTPPDEIAIHGGSLWRYWRFPRLDVSLDPRCGGRGQLWGMGSPSRDCRLRSRPSGGRQADASVVKSDVERRRLGKRRHVRRRDAGRLWLGGGGGASKRCVL
jgi:hypothetical protein